MQVEGMLQKSLQAIARPPLIGSFVIKFGYFKTKTMTKALILLFVFGLSFSACTKKHEVSKDSYEYFSTNLKPSMMYTEIVGAFGNPDSDLGSGIHIYVYGLEDGTSVWIGYNDHIVYARHMSSSDKNTAQLLHTMI
jgi:hypothetical protein